MFKKPVDEPEKHLFRPRPSLPSSAYTSPRPVPKVPSITSSIKSVFSSERRNKGLAAIGFGSPASASALSLRSTEFPDTSQITPSHSLPFLLHDTQNMPIVSPREPPEEEAECPVCLEPLSFSFRLPGEKPHIVPECSHALHEVFPTHLFFDFCALIVHPIGMFFCSIWSTTCPFKSRRDDQENQPWRLWGMSETDEGRGWGRWKIQQCVLSVLLTTRFSDYMVVQSSLR